MGIGGEGTREEEERVNEQFSQASQLRVQLS